MLDITLHPSAFNEYKKAFRWYQRRSLNAAMRFDQEVQSGLRRIAENPQSFPKIGGDFRQLLLKRFRYSIIYRRYHKSIHVLAIAHASRRPGYWKRRIDDPSTNGHRNE